MGNHKKFWAFKAAANDKPAELLLYGEISDYSWWGDEVTPKQFKKDLDALGDVDKINVFINSPGGDVFAGQAIHSMLKRHKAQIHVYVDGLAASAASVVAMAGDVIYMPRNAMMMIHNPWTWGVGYASDFRKVADELDKIRETLVEAYKAKTGLEDTEIIAVMDAETWLTAEEAVEKGFADEIEETKQVAASIDGGFLVFGSVKMDLSRCKNAPKFVHLNTPELLKPAGAEPPDNLKEFERRLQLEEADL
jgi:ATP-dependent Clp protease protease subunit